MPASTAETTATFQKFDADGKGVISREQLVFVLKEIDPIWNDAKCKALFQVAGVGSSGDIQYADFLKFVIEGPPGAAKYVYSMLMEQEGGVPDKNEAGRYLIALFGCYCKDMPVPRSAKALESSGGQMTEAEWLKAISAHPELVKAMEADYNTDTGRLRKHRSCQEQLSKLLCNIDRVRRRIASGEEPLSTKKLEAEVESRKKQVAKLTKNGIKPHPGLCVFNQMDIDKSRSIDKEELGRMFEALSSVYHTDKKKIKEIMAVLDADKSGEIDETEWIEQLEKLPELEAALMKDLDPVTGHLRSFRSPEERFGKILGNIDRLEYQASKAKITQKDKDKVAKELKSRRDAAQRFRIGGIRPSAGVMVFNQLDKKKTRALKMTDLKELCEALKYKEISVEEVMKALDFNNDGSISEKEWLDGLDHCQTFKAALEKDVDPETGKLKTLITAEKASFDMLRRQEGAWFVDKREVGRFCKALQAVYKSTDASAGAVIDALMADKEGKMSPDEWPATLDSLPDLKAKLVADYDKDKARFSKFRSCGQQLSKLLGNLDRLRRKEAMGENVSAEIESRKKQVKKLRDNGINPSPGLCVFQQLDVSKNGLISRAELDRLFKGLQKVFNRSADEIAEVMNILDSDQSGDIDEAEWMNNLRKCPGLRKMLVQDMDPDTGKLRSYRSVEDQLAKLLGNIQRLEFDAAKGKDVAKELASRKEQAAKMRKEGVVPGPGVIVFNQIDKKKKRKITMAQLKELLVAVKVEEKSAEDIMKRLDADKNGCIEEQEWLHGLDRAQSLKAALIRDMDPDTGKLRSYA